MNEDEDDFGRVNEGPLKNMDEDRITDLYDDQTYDDAGVVTW